MSAGSEADSGQLYFGGDVYTVDDSMPGAAVVAVRDGSIVAAGSEDECRAALGSEYETFDLAGRALLPGFIDTHLHPVVMAYYDMNVDLRGVRSIRELQEKMAGRAGAAGTGDWTVGLSFDEQDLDQEDSEVKRPGGKAPGARRLPTRHDLDEACPDRPAIVIKHDGHTLIANTRAIEAAGVTADTVDPDGGVIDREEDGHPAGAFRENAAQTVMSAMPPPDLDALTDGAKHAFARLAANGITSVGAILQTETEGPAGSSGAFDVPVMSMLLEHLPASMYVFLIGADIEKILEAKSSPLHQAEIGGNRIGGVKIFADGTFGSCTAYMHEPFTDQPDKTGFMTHSEEEVYRRMVASHEADLQIAIHAIGDKANRVCVDLYERLLTEHPREDHRHRIEHASILTPDTIEDMARLRLIVATQPLFIQSEKHWLHRRLGPERAKWTYPLRTLLDAGVRIAGASDSPVESMDVLDAIHCCVTREGFEPEQSITAAEAIRMFTFDAAYAQFENSVKGSITPGKRADLVVLSKNPATASSEELHEIRVERTVRGGDVVYQA